MCVDCRKRQVLWSGNKLKAASGLRHMRNTRFRRLAKPYRTGTFTPQDTPSFAWRSNAVHKQRLHRCLIYDDVAKISELTFIEALRRLLNAYVMVFGNIKLQKATLRVKI